MDGILGLFQGVSEGKLENIPIYLKAFDNHQCLQKASNARIEFISHLTGLLSSTSTRYEGLVLLEKTLKQCPLDILEQKGSLWAGLCIKTCNQKNMYTCVPIACRALGLLAEKSVDIPELSKAFTNHLLGNFFDSLKNTQGNAAHNVLDCIEIALRVYPSACGQHRGVIEKFVGSFIDCRDRNVVRSASRCLHLLQQIRGGNTVGTSYQETWQKLQLGLIGELHSVLDDIFVDCPEIHEYVDHLEKWNFLALQLSDEPIPRATQLFYRFKNLITYLLTILVEPFPVAKLIMPRKILNFIQRGLSIDCKLLEKSPTANNQAIGALLPDIHVEIFNLLDALILTLKTNMAPYVHTVLSCVLETLKWTNPGKSKGFTKSFSKLRIAAYNSLALWNDTFQNGSCCELIAEHIIEQIKNDITPFHNEVTLKVLSGGKKHISKKARRLLHKAQNEQSNLAQMHSKTLNSQHTKIVYSDEGNQELCVAALNCLKSIIQTTTLFLKPVQVKDIFDTVFSIAMHVINYDEILKTVLYSNYLCRISLYNVVYATTTDIHHLCPPPIQLIIEILSTAQSKDRNIFVRRDCAQYLKALEKIIHPEKDSIYYPIEKRDIENALSEKHDYTPNYANQTDDTDSDDEKSDAIDESLKYEAEEDKIDEEIDLTESQTENERLEPPIQTISDCEEVVEKISLGSSSEEKSPDIMEVCDDNVELVGSTNVEENLSEENAYNEPLLKRPRTTSQEEGESSKDIHAEETREQEDNVKPIENFEGESSSLIKAHETTEDPTDPIKDRSEEEANALAEECLLDFVYELNED